MTLAQLTQLVGARAQWAVPARKVADDGTDTSAPSSTAPLTIPVTIIDARESFGRVDVLIQPVDGTGARWVDRVSVEIQQAEDEDDA